MREILFRGKRVDNGRWVEGQYTCEEYEPHLQKVLHIDRIAIAGACVSVGVIPETVGQYTGLKDKNGTRIFEKDIVACRQDESTGISIIIFEHGAFYVMPERGNIYERTLWDYWYNDWDIEVIGNIHDNPELLKGE